MGTYKNRASLQLAQAPDGSWSYSISGLLCAADPAFTKEKKMATGLGAGTLASAKAEVIAAVSSVGGTYKNGSTLILNDVGPSGSPSWKYSISGQTCDGVDPTFCRSAYLETGLSDGVLAALQSEIIAALQA